MPPILSPRDLGFLLEHILSPPKFICVKVNFLIFLLDLIQKAVPALFQFLVLKLKFLQFLHLFVLNFHLFVQFLVFSVDEI